MNLLHHLFLFRGAQQIRTAVDGFADRYLATRSGHQIYVSFLEVPSRFELLWTVLQTAT